MIPRELIKKLRKIEIHGTQEPYRAQLIRAVRNLLQDRWDGPSSAA